MPVKNALRILVFALAAAAVAAQARDPEQIQKDIGDRVYCLCGCVTTLNHCPHPDAECSTKTEMRALIAKDIKEGKTEPQILQDFVLKYGVKVLAAPPPEGFNLTAWVLPGVGLILGLIVAIDIARRWRRPAADGATAAAEPDPNVLAAVEDEMRKNLG